MYSLTDQKIIEALNQKAQDGVDITVMHDPSSSQKGFESLAMKRIPIHIQGLMHKKILIVDHEQVWIGSANFTTESLRLHDNLVAGLISPELAKTILSEGENHKFLIGGQVFEFWILPRDKKEGFARLIGLIDQAKESVRVAMYTWTHPELTEAVIRAHKRGVSVEVILDRGQANGVGLKETKRLINSGIPVWQSNGRKLLHHKCLWVDETILANGSANWTRSAFSRNQDCFFILHDLTQQQQTKLRAMWNRTRILSDKKHLLIFRQRPEAIRNAHFETVCMAA